ncbi:MAG: hypothetical protein WC766_01210 [Patescibacteria group bacterium]|jgi:hypothetical protein
MTNDSKFFKQEPTAPTQEKPTQEEWEAYKNKIEKLKSKIDQKVLDVLGEDDGDDWLRKKIIDFSNQLKHQVSNPRSYVAWHRLTHSTVDSDYAPWLDFTSPNSVKEFCEKLLLELDDKQKCLEYLQQ